jgi:hypothetical protein
MNLEVGKWYYVVDCVACGKVNAVGLAPSEKAQPLASYAWPATVHCDCGKHHTYQAGEVRRIQHRKA